jgi:hypothetical protein
MINNRVKTVIVSNRARCLKCNDIIESKHRHDFVMCSCESIFVDGGTSYLRRGGTIENIQDLSEVVEVTDEKSA